MRALPGKVSMKITKTFGPRLRGQYFLWFDRECPSFAWVCTIREGFVYPLDYIRINGKRVR
jgi:hypothetical protein